MAEKHYDEQRTFAQSYLIPYFKSHLPDFKKMKILEIGCAEAGLLAVLAEDGIDVSGLELEASRVTIAKEKNPRLTVLTGDITDTILPDKITDRFELIILRDVIEHIADRTAAFTNMINLLNPGGYLYITFPPKFSGFAGHQQNAASFLRLVPFLHLFPASVIRWLGKRLREHRNLIESIITNYRIGLTIHSFENYCKSYKLKPVVQDLFLVRPVFQIRYQLKARKMISIPILREVLATGCEYLLQRQV
jgi:SAM-dependent methyltransferase